VQKHNTGYGKFENGNKISFNELLKYLQRQNPEEGEEIYNRIQEELKTLATHAIRSVYNKIDPTRK